MILPNSFQSVSENLQCPTEVSSGNSISFWIKRKRKNLFSIKVIGIRNEEEKSSFSNPQKELPLNLELAQIHE
jgi:hypothetical protein